MKRALLRPRHPERSGRHPEATKSPKDLRGPSVRLRRTSGRLRTLRRGILLGFVGGLVFAWAGEGNVFSQTPKEEKAADRIAQLAGIKKGAAPAKAKKQSPRIQIGDRVRIKIYPEDEYIKGVEMEVSSEGTITLPLIGKVKVGGMRVIEAEREIMQLLSKDYLVSPVVVIEVEESTAEKQKRSVAILGQIQKPGTYEIPSEQRLTLLQLISMAGGFTEIANVKKIKVIRKEKGKTRVIQANAEAIISGKVPDLSLKPEDIVHVGESFF